MCERFEISEVAFDDPEVARFTELQSAERSRRNKIMERIWGAYLKTDQDDVLSKELDRLLDGAIRRGKARSASGAAGRHDEGRALVVMGEAGAGKSRALKRQFRNRKEFQSLHQINDDGPLVSISAPSPCTLKQLGLSLLRGLGYETDRDIRENIAWQMVRHQLRARNVKFVHIDEAQHAVQFVDYDERQKVSDTLKDIMHGADWPVWLILSGLPSLARFVEADSQLRRRCRFVRFAKLTDPANVGSVQRLVGSFVGLAELDGEAALTEELAKRLIHASLGQFGTSVELVQDAIEECLIEEQTALGPEHFAAAYAGRTGCETDQNVFLAREWEFINAAKVLYPPEEDENIFESAKSKKNRRNRSAR